MAPLRGAIWYAAAYEVLFRFMSKNVNNIRAEAMGLSLSERASLAHDLILSLDRTEDFELSPEQESEVRRRVAMVREGKASGRPASEVFADIRAKHG